MASGPITSWHIEEEAIETMTDFIFLGSNVIAGDDCILLIKRGLLFRRKAMTNLDSIFKSRDVTLPTKVRLVKAMVFPAVMYGCEIWTITKADFGTLWEKARVGCSERIALKQVYYQG